MKLIMLSIVLLAAFSAQAMEIADSTAFSSKKEVEVEPGADKLVVLRAQPELARFLETGVMSAQAKSVLVIMSKAPGNADKSEEQLAFEALSVK